MTLRPVPKGRLCKLCLKKSVRIDDDGVEYYNKVAYQKAHADHSLSSLEQIHK